MLFVYSVAIDGYKHDIIQATVEADRCNKNLKERQFELLSAQAVIADAKRCTEVSGTTRDAVLRKKGGEIASYIFLFNTD